MDVVKIIIANKGLIAFARQIDCDHATMGLPPVTTAVLFTAIQFW
jgi:hypothetical protein